MKRRSYRGHSDVELLQDFNAAATAQTAGCGYLHPGDIPHHLFSGNKLYDLAKALTIWEDSGGVAAWVLAGPRHRSCDIQLRPDLRGAEFEREVLVFAENRLLELMRHYMITGDQIFADAFRCDTARIELLTDLGWLPDGDPPWVVNRISLVDLPEPLVPDGYLIRAVRGIDEAPALAELHSASFGSSWTAEQYRTLMGTPGYAAEREFIVQAADGTFAAFTVTWHDRLNRTALFEPVGTHPDHRRRGLGRALLQFAMHKMAAVRMEYAIVVNSGTNEASRGLYRAAGFKPWHLIDGFAKPLSPRPPDAPDGTNVN